MKERMPAGAERFARVIREGRTAAGLNQQQLAEKLGVSRATVAGWETSHSRPDLDLLPKLCSILGVSVAAFFGVKEKITPEERNFLIVLRNMEKEDRMAILWQAEALMEKRRSWRMQELREKAIRLYRSDLSAAAGIGATLDEARGEQVWLLGDDRTRRADEIITVSGCSMEPTFFDGDELLVEHTTALREGEIGIFLVNGEGYVKEYRRDGLHSHNPAYPTMRFSAESDVRCVGRVLGKVDEAQWPTKAQLELLEEMRF